MLSYHTQLSNNAYYVIASTAPRSHSFVSQQNLNRGFRTSGVSRATQSKIKKHCRVLSYAARKRKVRKPDGSITKHLLQFITLTLCSPQQHSDSFITNNVFASFLDRARKVGLLSNYVWKAEKQKNGNIHYHIITDTFAAWSLYNRLWLHALERFGYLQAYTDKFSQMDFEEYMALPFNEKREEKHIRRAFEKGQKNGWKQPPATQLEQVTNVEKAAAYIAKYVSKDESEEKNIVTGRVWSCSRSVSEATRIFCTDRQLNRYWFTIATTIFKAQEYEQDFFTIIKLDFFSLCRSTKDLIKYIRAKMYEAFKPCQFRLIAAQV